MSNDPLPRRIPARRSTVRMHVAETRLAAALAGGITVVFVPAGRPA